MRKMTSIEIRNMWLKYFSEHGHEIVPSASLIPYDDDTLLWINAGVTPLKKYFDGSVVPKCRRLTNLQKCIRTNDIENVGVTRRHHTFFEMMGNFSVGDYFKEEAIKMAYELLTSPNWFNIPVEKLYVTVFTDDRDAYNLWKGEGMPCEHIIKLDDNFWEIGVGPCGPDSEIFFDRGDKYDPDGDALEKFKKGEDNERFVEIWNNVFSQFNSEPGKDRKDYQELPSKNIDTGAGLERWACIFQDADSNFDTDLFMPIIKQVEDLSGVVYDGSMPFKVIADHIRALTFALADGATFENVGRGYILRRLLRRSVRFGRKLSLNGLFMYKLVDNVVSIMKDFYPYLLEKQEMVKNLIKEEEELFNKTLVQGEKKLYELMDESIDNTISGYDAFKLYDTYGFPFELTLEYLEEKGFTTNKEEFDKYMTMQRELSKSSQKHENSMNLQNETLLNYKKDSEFVYDIVKCKSLIMDLIKDNVLVDSLDREGYVIFDKTCFYATSGGQVSDTGMIISNDFKARVLDVFKAPNGQHIHKVKVLSGVIKKGDKADLIVDDKRRHDIEANHSAVHLLQYALREIISKDIYQAGSRVDDLTLRFDFNYRGSISDEQLILVENRVNELIKESLDRNIEVKDINDVDKNEVMAIFQDKYHDKVRVVTLGPSKELCGGTHVKNTSLIKRFAILSIENKGSNTYRIEAATADRIEEMVLEHSKTYNDEIVKLLLKSKTILNEARENGIDLKLKIDLPTEDGKSYKDIVNLHKKMNVLQEEVHTLEKRYNRLKDEKALNNIEDFRGDITVIHNTNLLLKKTNNLDTSSIKQILDNLANEYENIFILIANIKNNETVNFISRSNCDLSSGMVVKEASTMCNGKGGGSIKFAQGAGKDLEKIDEVFAFVKEKLNEQNQ